MSKTETTKAGKKKDAEKATAPETKVATAPEAKTEEAPKAAPTQEAPASEDQAPAAETEGKGEAEDSLNLGSLFSTLVGGLKDSDLFKELKESGFAFAPEGFAFNEDDLGFDGPCGVPCDADADYNAGIAEGVRRAQHPVFGIGITVPEPVVSAPSPIVIRDEETRSMAHLVELKKLHDVGILTDAEFNAKKTDILRRIY